MFVTTAFLKASPPGDFLEAHTYLSFGFQGKKRSRALGGERKRELLKVHGEAVCTREGQEEVYSK